MTYKQQLTDLLCTEKSVDKQIKELKFGCIVLLEGKTKGFYTGWWEERLINGTDERYKIYEFQYNGKNRCLKKISEIEIIGNPIEDRHLRIYCEIKGIYCIFDRDKIIINKNIYKNETHNVIDLDKTKPLSEQSEEVFEQILIALKGLSN